MHPVSRLIHQFLPDHYNLYIQLNRLERIFKGTVTIHGTSLTDAKSIVVHSKKLVIESITIDGKKATWNTSTNDELAITHPDIREGRHVIVIAFQGDITDAMHGLYPCYYMHNGIQKELLATQFESHHAREVFPCIDEPEAKATFDLTLITEKDITVLGNMPIKLQKLEDDQLVTTFATTPRMSTYLLAWVTGELHRKTKATKSGVEVNVWATPAQSSDNLDFALDAAVRTIDFLDDYFDTPYPLPKSDHVALPDFSAGAMENWGLVTYREVALLANPRTMSASNKQYIAMVIAHELSHQWFGNLVTMKWWDNLWLNESFATLMATLVTDNLYPEWDEWLKFATSEGTLALRRDALDGVQPVQIAVDHPDQINSLFDPAIVYAKGARLLRMLQHYIGDEAFQTGLKKYFATHAYSNTEADDLWQAFAQASGQDITDFMHTWISQAGYPVVNVQQNGSQLVLSQQQFFIGPHQSSDKLWPIPLGASDGALASLLTDKETTTAYDSIQPLRLNVGNSAHFITKYDDALLDQRVNELRGGTLSPLDRIQLLHEQTLLARAGMISSAELIPLLDAFSHESSEPVWNIVGLTINELKKFVETSDEAEQKLRALVRRIAHEQYIQLGWQPKSQEAETDTKRRAVIIALTLYGEDPEAIETALNLYATTPIEQLDPELRPLIIGAAVRHTHQPELINTLLQLYQSNVSADLRDDIASGLMSTRDEATVKQLLTTLTDTSIIRHQDVKRWFARLMQNQYARKLSWQWLQDNWSWIEATFGSDKSYDYYPRYAASGLMTHQQFEEYKAFFSALQNEPALTRAITIGIAEISGRIELIDRDTKAVHQALSMLDSIK